MLAEAVSIGCVLGMMLVGWLDLAAAGVVSAMAQNAPSLLPRTTATLLLEFECQPQVPCTSVSFSSRVQPQ